MSIKAKKKKSLQNVATLWLGPLTQRLKMVHLLCSLASVLSDNFITAVLSLTPTDVFDYNSHHSKTKIPIWLASHDHGSASPPHLKDTRSGESALHYTIYSVLIGRHY